MPDRLHFSGDEHCRSSAALRMRAEGGYFYFVDAILTGALP
jgi:hypothetical protein